jgi:hypothetical protein
MFKRIREIASELGVIVFGDVEDYREPEEAERSRRASVKPKTRATKVPYLRVVVKS